LADLWRPSEHEPLAGGEWDEARAEGAIAAIVADAEAAFDGERWPWHPRDGEDDGSSNIYLGGAGMIWALHELGSAGWEDAARAFVQRRRTEPLFNGDSLETSYSFGELGVALVAFRLTGDAGLADRVQELVVAVHDSETNEVMAGSPGTLLVAEAMLAWTGEQRWDEAWCSVAERVIAARDDDGLWTQHFSGPPARYLGPAHRYAGNMRALANRGEAPTPADLSPYLLHEDGLVNWMPREESRPDEIRVQWCHGAPGMVTTLGDRLDLELALAGGELTWRAGPLAKVPTFVTERRATRMRSSSSTGAPEMSSGSSGHGPSPCTRSGRSSESVPRSAGGVTPSSPGTSALRYSSGICSTARPGSRRWGRSARA
jgi:hypothetical protein